MALNGATIIGLLSLVISIYIGYRSRLDAVGDETDHEFHLNQQLRDRTTATQYVGTTIDSIQFEEKGGIRYLANKVLRGHFSGHSYVTVRWKFNESDIVSASSFKRDVSDFWNSNYWTAVVQEFPEDVQHTETAKIGTDTVTSTFKIETTDQNVIRGFVHGLTEMYGVYWTRNLQLKNLNKYIRRMFKM